MKRGEVYQVVLDPTKGSEQQGFRQCVIVSPDSLNAALNIVIVAPLSTKIKEWPTRVGTFFEGVAGQVLCEQIRVVDKVRLKKKMGSLLEHEINEIRFVLKQMFFD